ncbi:MAG: peptide-methionine (S)-S-oxide reductase [Bacteroidota bacterium]|nr:peptide-methionine (S)-S-oxide reductase [Bacteroidota bacterium]
MKNLLIIFLLLIIYSCNSEQKMETEKQGQKKISDNMKGATDTAVFAGGCFWCLEAEFQELKGVYSVESGYSGGNMENPSYEDVCTGTTGYAEAVKVVFNPDIISFEKLLEVFWTIHDPTTLNRQGHDIGTQYRSAIFSMNDVQQLSAEKYMKLLNAQKVYEKPIVTEISPLKNFYMAEDYHLNYYKNNPYQPYCSIVIKPKLDKIRSVFKDLLK